MPFSPYLNFNRNTKEALTLYKKAFEVLRENGKVEMEIQETFRSKSYGSLVDKFGVGWQFNLNNE